MRLLAVLLLVGVILISGCVGKTSDAVNAKLACIQECQKALDAGIDLSNGPCLSDEIIEDWVCDVAHSHRQAVDNNQANQCEAFRKGEAHHFVEVDPECNFIKTY